MRASGTFSVRTAFLPYQQRAFIGSLPGRQSAPLRFEVGASGVSLSHGSAEHISEDPAVGLRWSRSLRSPDTALTGSGRPLFAGWALRRTALRNTHPPDPPVDCTAAGLGFRRPAHRAHL